MYDDDYEDYDAIPYDGYNPYQENMEEMQKQRTRRFYGETISGVLNAVTEYARTPEHEKTNRANVERKRKSALAVIKSERQVMLEYLKQRFGERGSLYEQYFKLIDTALQVENEDRYFFLALILFLCNNINMLVFMKFFKNVEDLSTHANIARITAFCLFLFSNVTVFFITLAMHKKASLGIIIKMILTIILLYIPINIVFSFGK